MKNVSTSIYHLKDKTHLIKDRCELYEVNAYLIETRLEDNGEITRRHYPIDAETGCVIDRFSYGNNSKENKNIHIVTESEKKLDIYDYEEIFNFVEDNKCPDYKYKTKCLKRLVEHNFKLNIKALPKYFVLEICCTGFTSDKQRPYSLELKTDEGYELNHVFTFSKADFKDLPKAIAAEISDYITPLCFINNLSADNLDFHIDTDVNPIYCNRLSSEQQYIIFDDLEEIEKYLKSHAIQDTITINKDRLKELNLLFPNCK